MKTKKYYFISSLVFFPMMLLMSLLLINDYLNGMIYIWLFLGCFVAFWISFIFSLFFTTEEIINSNNRKRILYLFFAPFIYLPLYYIKSILERKSVYGITLALLNVCLLLGLFFSMKSYTEQYMYEKYLGVTPIFYTYNK